MNQHKDCKNFKSLDSWCTLKDKQVNPDDPCCDKFQPIGS